jgi:hypothetical protein
VSPARCAITIAFAKLRRAVAQAALDLSNSGDAGRPLSDLRDGFVGPR